MYQPHPSSELTELFRQRPYQGVEPSTATFLFIGLDANYAPDVEHSASFRNILDYHKDGAAFWQRHGVHHPFLLPEYRGDGSRYHRTFSRIGFTPDHANLVSFTELLHLPTVGRSNLLPEDLDRSHLQQINSAILQGNAKHIFISAGVARLMHSTKLFPWLAKRPAGDGPLRTFYSDQSRSVYSHLHFSNYGKFQAQLDAEALAIAALLPTGA